MSVFLQMSLVALETSCGSSAPHCAFDEARCLFSTFCVSKVCAVGILKVDSCLLKLSYNKQTFLN